jgi:phosphoenolpyruvate carboxykinase (GTP)
MGEKIAATGVKLPSIYCVNWFRTDENGKFVWPGFGDNMRVLKWMLDRIEGKAGGIEHIFGLTPSFDDLTWDGLQFTAESFQKITSIDFAAWEAEVKLHDELFEKLKHRLPSELAAVKAELKKKLTT